jgi:glycosyltransferase involved in cell wall biosynthesis
MLWRSYEDRQLQRFYEQADALFVHSQAQADDLLEFARVAPERVHIVPHGAYDYGRPAASREELRERLKWPRDKQVALFFGNVRDDKNLDVMLRALARHRDDLHVVVAGRGVGSPHKPMADYHRLAEELGLIANVTFDERYISDAEIPDLFEACDWVALPYSRSFTSQSGVLNVAVSYRRPVLLSATPTFVETLSQADVGILAPPDDVEGLTAGIGDMIAAVGACRTFDFDEYLRLFGWETNVRITCEVYRSLVN